jgi:hypothetical protein
VQGLGIAARSHSRAQAFASKALKAASQVEPSRSSGVEFVEPSQSPVVAFRAMVYNSAYTSRVPSYQTHSGQEAYSDMGQLYSLRASDSPPPQSFERKSNLESL